MQSYEISLENRIPIDLDTLWWIKNWKAVIENYWMINDSALIIESRICWEQLQWLVPMPMLSKWFQ